MKVLAPPGHRRVHASANHDAEQSARNSLRCGQAKNLRQRRLAPGNPSHAPAQAKASKQRASCALRGLHPIVSALDLVDLLLRPFLLGLRVSTLVSHKPTSVFLSQSFVDHSTYPPRFPSEPNFAMAPRSSQQRRTIAPQTEHIYELGVAGRFVTSLFELESRANRRSC